MPFTMPDCHTRNPYALSLNCCVVFPDEDPVGPLDMLVRNKVVIIIMIIIMMMMKMMMMIIIIIIIIIIS